MNSLLTDKQEKFCQLYATTRSASDAYRGAFDVGPSTKDESVRAMASQLLANAAITKRLGEIIAQATAELPAVYELENLLTRILQAATADTNEIIQSRRGACRYCHGSDHQYQWREREFWEATAKAEKLALKDPTVLMPDIAGGFGYRWNVDPHPDCPECEGLGTTRVILNDSRNLSPGALMNFQGVKQKADGSIEVALVERTKWWDMAFRIMGAYKDNVTLKGGLSQAIQAVNLTTTDPAEAAKLYAEMVAAGSAR